MLFSFLFSIFLASTYHQNKVNGKSRPQTSFNFMTSQNKQFTLQSPNNYLPKRGILSKIIKKLISSSAGDWYYVHFLTDDLQKISKQINIKSDAIIVKNTFILYLTKDELSKIADISLVKKLLPEDKYQESEDKLSKTNYFQVVTKHDSTIPSNSQYYSIIQQESTDTYLIRVDQDSQDNTSFIRKNKLALNELSHISTVKLISTFSEPTFSSSIMNGYIQKNQLPISIQTDKKTGNRYLERYVNNNGITGSGETITIFDTPIDFTHAMFRDDKSEVKFNSPIEHRKFVYYASTAKNINEWTQRLQEKEHGTMMAGIAAGKSECGDDSYGTSMFDGNAPDAKIIYAGNPAETQTYKPSHLEALMKTYNSYISSNSWGIDNGNDEYNREFGRIAYDNPEQIYLFAAGNSFKKGEKEYFTIGDPGSSKNVLTISGIGSFYEEIPWYRIQNLRTGNSVQIQSISDANPWIRGTFGPLTSDGITMIDAALGNQCHKLNNGHASVIYSTVSDISWIYQCDYGKMSTTGVLFAYNPDEIRSLQLEGGEFLITDDTSIDVNSKVTQFRDSSAGPGRKGILKPDVAGPGHRVVSPTSLHQNNVYHGCPKDQKAGNFTIGHGTSIAAASIAGASALVRQYFRSGRWTDKVDLDGTTLRALIINSCNHPSGSKTPDLIFGHGVVDLSNILPLDNSFGVQITNTKQQKNKPSVGENKHVTAKLKVTPNKRPLQITLSYLDEMLDASSPIPISRDLDLVVVSPSNKVFKGDHLSNGDTQHFSTNEKIIIDNPEQGEYYVHVIGGDFIDSLDKSKNQDFAVVASGPVSNGYLTFSEPTKCPCGVCDSNNPLACACSSENSIGAACQAEVPHKSASQRYTTTVGPLQIGRVHLKADSVIKSVFTRGYDAGSYSSVWVSPTCSLSLQKYETNGQVGSSISVGFGTDEVCVAVFNNNNREAIFEIMARTGGGDSGDGGDGSGDGDSGDGGDGDGGASDGDDPNNSGSGGSGGGNNKGGVIAGAVIGVIAALAIAGVVAYFVIKRKREKAEQSSTLVRSSFF